MLYPKRSIKTRKVTNDGAPRNRARSLQQPPKWPYPPVKPRSGNDPLIVRSEDGKQVKQQILTQSHTVLVLSFISMKMRILLFWIQTEDKRRGLNEAGVLLCHTLQSAEIHHVSLRLGPTLGQLLHSRFFLTRALGLASQSLGVRVPGPRCPPHRHGESIALKVSPSPALEARLGGASPLCLNPPEFGLRTHYSSTSLTSASDPTTTW